MRADAILIVGGLLTLASCNTVIHFATMDEVSATVTGKERVVSGSGESVSSKYLVFTDGETFKNTDSWLALKFSSSDLHGSLKDGDECQMRVTGLRIPFLSAYRNILEASCQTPKKPS